MAMRYGFFDSEITGEDEEGQPIFDRAENAEFVSKIFSALVTNGVYADPADNFAVRASSGMNITVKAGRGFVNGRFAWTEQDTALTVSAANNTLPRIDAVVLRLSMTDRTISLAIKTGTAASPPSAPSLTRTADIYELRLANISVGAGAKSIKQADVTDTRYDTSQCGIVTGVIDQIDTTSLFTQYDDQFKTWFENLENTLDENQATNLQNNINKLEEKSLSVKTNLTTEDLDTVQTTGIYIQNYTSNATTDRHYPVKTSGCLMCISAESKAYQYYICQNEGCIWMRRYNSKSWSDWEQIYPSVTSGSNDRGTWIKYPDGTMICSIRRTDQVIETDGIVVTFPQEFADNNYTAVVNVARPYDMVACADCNYTATTNVWFYNLDGSSTAWEMVTYTMIAIGRWKRWRR